MGTLHGINLSPFVRKARIVLGEKGIEYDVNPVIPMGVSDDFKKMSPLGKIPVYSPQAGLDIPDSSVIIAYLERTQPQNSVYPEDAGDFARALFLEEYGDSVLVAACGTVFFNRFVSPKVMGQPGDDNAVKEALETTLPPLLSWLDAKIGNNAYFVGGRFSVADLAIASPLINLMHGGETVDASKYPNLAKWFAGILERPSIAALVSEEQEGMKAAA